MKKNWLKKATIAGMTVVMMTGGASAAFAHGNGHDGNNGRNKDDGKGEYKEKNHKITWKFKDEDDLKWALEYIMRLASKGVFNGYEDGTFKPQQKISRIETLTAAVRLMGLQDQAESAAEMSTELNFKDADKIASKYPWAVGYVAVALENDLFAETETEVKPEQNATRLWSTILLVKALKLDDEAKKMNNAQLDFKDADQIPAGAVGYVALALEKGIITGYNDNGVKTFRPNQPVTRAELAALLDRTDGEMPDQDAQAIYGELKAAPSGGNMTLVKSDGSEQTLAIDPTVFIFRDDKKASISDLKAGDELFLRTYNQKVVFIEVTKKAEENAAFTKLGIVQNLGFDSKADLNSITITNIPAETTVTQSTYAVDDDVAIVGDSSLLKVGQLVEIAGHHETVESITIK
ncbi:S-layer homology domain-containing protein [Paenibacillus sp. HB172176]|uniref:S-layer homology domain-containing protein n=1 Tax=Paenibacillus sp. HB172176 TaxID=2493690 RepID=UPI00143B76A7|nr:S-layer homology domain-containing protein [Paenibacillus sp. HB172176]